MFDLIDIKMFYGKYFIFVYKYFFIIDGDILFIRFLLFKINYFILLFDCLVFKVYDVDLIIKKLIF